MKSFSQLMSQIAEASTTPTDVSVVDSVNEETNHYKVSVEVGPPGGGTSHNKHVHVHAKNEMHAKKMARQYVKDRGHKLYGINSVSIHEGEELGDNLDQLEPIQELEDGGTLVITPHGNKDGFYKVVVGIDGYMQEGEVVHESHVDDLFDLGYDVLTAEGHQLDEISKDLATRYTEKAKGNLNYHSTAWDSLAKLPSFGKKEQQAFDTHDKEAEKRYKGIKLAKKTLKEVLAGVSESAPDFNAPERTEEEEKKIATGEIHGDYKGHAAAMRKKHNISK